MITMCTLNLDAKGITTMNYSLFLKKWDEVTWKVVRDDPDEKMGRDDGFGATSPRTNRDTMELFTKEVTHFHFRVCKN